MQGEGWFGEQLRGSWGGRGPRGGAGGRLHWSLQWLTVDKREQPTPGLRIVPTPVAPPGNDIRTHVLKMIGCKALFPLQPCRERSEGNGEDKRVCVCSKWELCIQPWREDNGKAKSIIISDSLCLDLNAPPWLSAKDGLDFSVYLHFDHIHCRSKNPLSKILYKHILGTSISSNVSATTQHSNAFLNKLQYIACVDWISISLLALERWLNMVRPI